MVSSIFRSIVVWMLLLTQAAAEQDMQRVLSLSDGEQYDYVLFLGQGRDNVVDTGEWIPLDAPAQPLPPRLVTPYKYKKLDNELFVLGFERGQTETGEDTILFQSDQVYDDEGERLTEKGQKLVNRLSFLLRQYSLSEIRVEVHTDALGSIRDNILLSSEIGNIFARALREALESDLRISVEPKGEGSPIATNNQAIGRAKNRRIELVLLKDLDS